MVAIWAQQAEYEVGGVDVGTWNLAWISEEMKTQAGVPLSLWHAQGPAKELGAINIAEYDNEMHDGQWLCRHQQETLQDRGKEMLISLQAGTWAEGNSSIIRCTQAW